MTFIVPFLLALGVGAIGITRQAWRDEHSTWWAATIPLSDLGDLLSRVDVVLAPYYLFMRLWVAVFGDSVVALRLPSLVAMATAAGLTGVLGARLYGPWVGLTAGALFAVIPSVSRYAEEARPYAFAICFAVATVLALLSRRWVLLTIFVALTGLAHLVALTVLFAHLPLLRYPRRTPAAPALAPPAPAAPALAAPAPAAPALAAPALAAPALAAPAPAAPALAAPALAAPAPAAPAPAPTPARSSRFWGNRGYAKPGSNDFPENATITGAPPAAMRGARVGGAARVGDAARVGGAAAEGVAAEGVAVGVQWWRWAVAVGVGLVLVVPLGILGLRQSRQVDWIDASWVGLGTLPMTLARSGAVAGILGALAVLGMLASRVDRLWAVLVLWAAAPPLVVFVVAPQFFYYRYLLFTLPAWAVLAALGAYAAVRGLGRRRQMAVAVALCAAVLALGARDQVAVRRSPLAGDQDYRGAAGYLAAHMSARDSVYFAGYPDQRERFGFAYEMRAGPAPALCEELARCEGRVWQVTNKPVASPAGFTQLDAQAFQGIQLRLLTRD